MPIATFVQKELKNYKGEVIVFANSYTNSQQYMINSIRNLKALDSSINFSEGLFNKAESQYIEFIKNL